MFNFYTNIVGTCTIRLKFVFNCLSSPSCRITIHAISNYYDNIEVYLEDSSKNNNKLSWRLMKDSFNIKLSNEIPPIQIFNDRGIKTMAYSDFDKIEALNLYFSSISSIDDSNETLPNKYYMCYDTLCMQYYNF